MAFNTGSYDVENRRLNNIAFNARRDAAAASQRTAAGSITVSEFVQLHRIMKKYDETLATLQGLPASFRTFVENDKGAPFNLPAEFSAMRTAIQEVITQIETDIASISLSWDQVNGGTSEDALTPAQSANIRAKCDAVVAAIEIG